MPGAVGLSLWNQTGCKPTSASKADCRESRSVWLPVAASHAACPTMAALQGSAGRPLTSCQTSVTIPLLSTAGALPVQARASP